MSASAAGGPCTATLNSASAPWAAPETHLAVSRRLRARVAIDVVLASWRLDAGPRWRLLQRALPVFERTGLDPTPIQRALREDWAQPWRNGKRATEVQEPGRHGVSRTPDQALVARWAQAADPSSKLQCVQPRSRRERLAWQLVGRLLAPADPARAVDQTENSFLQIEPRREDAVRVLESLRPCRARQRAELEFAKAALRRRDPIDCFLRLQRITDPGLRAEAGWIARLAGEIGVPEMPHLGTWSTGLQAACDWSSVAPLTFVPERIGVPLTTVVARRLACVHFLVHHGAREPVSSPVMVDFSTEARLALRRFPRLVVEGLRGRWSLVRLIAEGRADAPDPLRPLLEAASRLTIFLPGPSRKELWRHLLDGLLTECADLGMDHLPVSDSPSVPLPSAASEAEQNVLRRGARSGLSLAVAACRELRFESSPGEALQLRLRSLRAAGVGEAGARRVAHWLERLPVSARPDQWFEALRWLAEADPGRASLLLCAKQRELVVPAQQVGPILRLLVERRELSVSTATAWLGLRCALERQLGSAVAAAQWLAELFEAQPLGACWPPAQLCVQLALRDDLGSVRCRDLAAAADRLVHRTRSSADLARLLCDSQQLALYSWHRPALLGQRIPKRDRDWGRIGRRLAKTSLRVSEQAIARLGHALGLPGRPGGSAADVLARIRQAGRDTECAASELGVRLRWLDAARDPLTWLRFADVVNNCWNSNHEFHRTSTLDDVLQSFLDPLTFCWHIGLAGSQVGEFRPSGFVLGGFALFADGRPAVALNGIYSRSRSPKLRLAILAAIESGFCQPLGIDLLGTANRHGGYGELPKGFTQSSLPVERLRALTTPGGALSGRCGEDGWDRVNVCRENGLMLWRPVWRGRSQESRRLVPKKNLPR